MPNRRWPRAALVLVVLATALGACSTVAPVLKDREFLSVRVTEGGAPKALVAGTRIALRFSEADVSASAGCNGLGGTYRIDLGKLLYESGGQTLKGCEPLLQAQDEWLVDFLDSDPTITLIGNDLTLDSGARSIHLRDREVAEPDLNIVGPTWTVETIIAGDAASSVPAGATATIVFKADGSFELDAGCNRGGGTWKLDGGGIAFSGVMLTKMACAGAGAQLEGAVLTVIAEGSVQASIEADVLTLSRDGSGLQLRG